MKKGNELLNRRTYLWILLIALIGVSSCEDLNKIITPDSKTTDTNNSGSSNDDDDDDSETDSGVGTWLFNNPDWNYSDLYEFRFSPLTGNTGDTTLGATDIVNFNGNPCWAGLSANPFKGRAVWCRISDVNTEISDTSNGYNDNPESLAVVGINLYFTALDETGSRKIYKYDQTVVTQISEFQIVWDGNQYPTVVGTKIYFTALDGLERKLYEYDGTTLTTLPETDSDGSDLPSHLTAVGNDLFYLARNESQERKLFRWDGTTNLEIDPSKYSAIDVVPFYVGTIGTDHYFKLFQSGNKMFRLSGSTLTQISIPLAVYPSGSSTMSVPIGAGFAYVGLFTSNKYKLYFFDGTTATQVSDTYPGGDDFPTRLTSINSKAYFQAEKAVGGNSLFEYDGTSTTQISDTNTNGSDVPTYITGHDGDVYFSARDSNGSNASKLYKYDGTDVTQVSNIHPGNENPTHMKSIGDDLYFSAVDENINTRLYKLDSNDDITEVSYTDNFWSHEISEMILHDSNLYINCQYGLFKWNGSDLTQALDFMVPLTVYGYSSLASVGENLYFYDTLNFGGKVAKLNGSTLTQVSDINIASDDYIIEMKAAGNNLYFIAVADSAFFKVFQYDGSSVTQVSDTSNGGDDMAYGLTSFNGVAYFAAADDMGDFHMYKHENGVTTLAFDTNPNGADDFYNLDINSYPPVVIGSTMYFIARNEFGLIKLFSWDGTDLVQISDTYVGGDDNPHYLKAMNGDLYFGAYDDTSAKLYRWDGTQVTQIFDSDASYLTVMGNHLYFGGYDYDDSANKLFRWDGSSVTQISPEGMEGVQNIFAAEEKVFFIAFDENEKTKLYDYDGTQVSMVADMNPGFDDFVYSTTPLVFQNDLYFTSYPHGTQRLMKIDF